MQWESGLGASSTGLSPASWRALDRRHPSWKDNSLGTVQIRLGGCLAAWNKRPTKRNYFGIHLLEVGPADKDAFEVPLVRDRISVAEPVTSEPSG